MDDNVNKMQSWLDVMNRRFDALDLKLDNRFNALLTAMTNLHDRVERYREEQQATNVLFSRAFHDLHRYVEHIKQVTL